MMKRVITLLAVVCLTGCSCGIYRTGWHPAVGTPRAAMVAKLGEPLSSVPRNDLPRMIGVFPTSTSLKDQQGREDRYITRRVVRDDPRGNGARFFGVMTYGAGELLCFPLAIAEHWLPRRRTLTLYYDRHDLLQAYTLDKPAAQKNR